MKKEMKYQINITPEISFMDEDVKIEIVGHPGESLQLQLITNDYYDINGDIRIMDVGSEWGSVIEVKLDGDGIKVLDASVFTTMHVVRGEKSKLEQDLAKLPENRKSHIAFKLCKENKVVAENLHERIFCDDTIISKNIISDQLLARYFTGSNFNKRQAVIVVSGSDGRIEKAQAIAQCLAMKGFSTLALCYFGMEHVPKDLDRIPMEYLKNAIAWLLKQPEVDADRIGIYGRSKGGEMVLLAASLFPQLKYVVANTPSNYVNEGIIGGARTSGHSSWCFEGNEIKFIKASKRSLLKLVIGLIKKNPMALRNFYKSLTWDHINAKHPDARIKIEKSNASFLFIASDTDGIWPSTSYIKEACEIMKSNGKENNCKQLCYAGAGHMLTLPYQPIPNCEEYGGIMKNGIQATIDSWKETVQFLKQM